MRCAPGAVGRIVVVPALAGHRTQGRHRMNPHQPVAVALPAFCSRPFRRPPSWGRDRPAWADDTPAVPAFADGFALTQVAGARSALPRRLHDQRHHTGCVRPAQDPGVPAQRVRRRSGPALAGDVLPAPGLRQRGRRRRGPRPCTPTGCSPSYPTAGGLKSRHADWWMQNTTMGAADGETFHLDPDAQVVPFIDANLRTGPRPRTPGCRHRTVHGRYGRPVADLPLANQTVVRCPPWSPTP